MAFSPSTKHKTTSTPFSSIVDATTGQFTQSLTVSGVPVITDPGDFSFSGAVIRKSGSQSMPNSTPIPVAFDLPQYDFGGWIETPGDTFFTVPNGISRIRMMASVHISANATNLRQLGIEIDTGSGFGEPSEGNPFDLEDADLNATDIIRVNSYPMTVNPGDKLRAVALQNSGVTLSIISSTANWMSIEALSGGVGFTGVTGATGAGALEFQKLDNTYAPVGLWNFEGNLLDSSGNGFDLEKSGTERYTRVHGLYAFKFDDATHLLHNVTGTALEITGDITIETLLLIHNYETNDDIVTYYTAGESESTNILYNFKLNSNGRFAYFAERNAGTDINYTTPDGILRGVLQHMVMVRENQVITFYIDGQQIGDPSATLNASTGGTASVFNVGGRSSGSELNAGMASLKVIDRALTPAEVEDEYNLTLGNRGRAVGAAGADGAQGVQGFTGADGPAGNALGFQKFDTTHSPVALYNFEDDLTDSSGNGLDLVVTLGVERYTSVEGLRAFYFNGGERLTHPAGTDLEIIGDITVEMLLISYRNNLEMILEYTGGAFTDNGTNFNTLYQVYLTTGHQIEWRHENSSQSDFTYTDPSAVMPLGTLSHVTSVRSNNQITFYVDGQQAGATSDSLSAAFGGSSAILNIGARQDNGSKFLGAMVSLKIIDFALSPSQIAAEYARTLGDNRSRV